MKHVVNSTDFLIFAPDKPLKMSEKRPATKRDRFELEALEPRLLLSADVLAAALIQPAPATSGAGTGASVIEVSSHAQTPMQAALAYDPAAQVDGIFEGVPECSTGGGIVSADGQKSGSGNAQSASQNSDSGAAQLTSDAGAGAQRSATQSTSSTEANPGVGVVAAEVLVAQNSSNLSASTAVVEPSVSGIPNDGTSDPMPGQMIQSLHGANGPPVSGESVVSSSDGVTSVNQFRIILVASQIELLDQRGLIVFSQAVKKGGEFVVFGDPARDNVFTVDGAVLDLSGLSIRIVGGQGHDTLRIDDRAGSNRLWNITGHNTGQVGNVSFSSIEQLVGGSNNNDTFTLAQSGMFHGVIDGGVGGFDTLVVRGTSAGSYTPGAVFGDGMVVAGQSRIQFTGLEPVIMDGTGVAGGTLTFTTPSTGDGSDILTIDSPASGQNRISGTSGGVPFESITFSNYANVVINTAANDTAGSTGDVVSFIGDLSATGLTNFTVTTGAHNDRIDLSQLGAIGASCL